MSEPRLNPDAADLLPVGTRIRSRHFPELTGYIKAWEYGRDGLSPIPYCIGWDDSAAARGLLGFLFVYAMVDGVESDPPAAGLAALEGGL